ncbi:Eukaryotic translation initiation factor 4E-binding protein 1 [Geranomyces variabilis]|uniref:Eukaryotic translation initiation factor 4E-binding protein 1 n=1 Tax=Geranomyces variabilis TaxID=109894 RepID=A0AAD5TE37_9FUNG|nr:Eukaryotic translation initiation factor 4E-binding protein 1 [Geranomyces variabilis]
MASNGYLSPPASAPVAVRRANPGEKPPHDYGTTPGGTIFGTTPGGTRIIYTKDALLSLSRSPLANTPPRGLAYIPGVTKVAPPKNNVAAQKPGQPKKDPAASKKPDDKDDLFEMEI